MKSASNQNIRVTKVFTFDMAHALFGYDGPCKNIHGHTYELSVTLKGKVLQENNHPKDGMVIDFTDFKQLKLNISLEDLFKQIFDIVKSQLDNIMKEEGNDDKFIN